MLPMRQLSNRNTLPWSFRRLVTLCCGVRCHQSSLTFQHQRAAGHSVANKCINPRNSAAQAARAKVSLQLLQHADLSSQPVILNLCLLLLLPTNLGASVTCT